jgi:hypothetical protein
VPLIRARDHRLLPRRPEDPISPQRLGALENNPVLLPAGKIHGDFAVFQAVESPRCAVAFEQRRTPVIYVTAPLRAPDSRP